MLQPSADGLLAVEYGMACPLHNCSESIVSYDSPARSRLVPRSSTTNRTSLMNGEDHIDTELSLRSNGQRDSICYISKE